MGKPSSIELFIFMCQTFHELSRNCFRFLPFVRPRIFKSDVRIDSKVVIITGCNTGIGKASAKKIAERGAKVIMACRNIEKGKEAAQHIINQVKNANIVVKKLDLSSLESVRNFAQEIDKEENSIDILINNAGVMGCPKSTINHSFETHFGTNHLGHFYLTLLLIDKLKKLNGIARIINVASALYALGKIDFDDINYDKNYNPFKAYCNTKLENILFSRELAKRLKNTNIRVYALHPGLVKTDLVRHMENLVTRICSYIFLIPTEYGCQTTLYCALDKDLEHETGQYYNNCTKYQNSGCVNYLLSHACDDEVAKKLWDLSSKMVKLEDKYQLESK